MFENIIEVDVKDLIEHHSELGKIFAAKNINENGVFYSIENQEITIEFLNKLNEKNIHRIKIFNSEKIQNTLAKYHPEKYTNKYLDRRVQKIHLSEFIPNLILHEDIYTTENEIIAKKWQKITPLLIDTLKKSNLVNDHFEVFIPDKLLSNFLYEQNENEAEKSLKKILIVDDEIFILDSLKDGLELYGFKVFTLNKSKEIIKTLRLVKPDLVILDINMPELNGFEVLAEKNKFAYLKEIPVIMLTARRLKQDVIDSIKLGAIDYVVKPVKTSELVKKIAKILNININENLLSEKNITSSEIDELLKKL
ncbi:MAG TPA: response regulator [bacterium]|nr:response regulator [bacterium]HOL48431.1 response regulator [bacterium]HPQ18673.1 response regulator [bacterium]